MKTPQDKSSVSSLDFTGLFVQIDHNWRNLKIVEVLGGLLNTMGVYVKGPPPEGFNILTYPQFRAHFQKCAQLGKC